MINNTTTFEYNGIITDTKIGFDPQEAFAPGVDKIERLKYYVSKRTYEYLKSIGQPIEPMEVAMDIDAMNFVLSIDLDKLLSFDDANFFHDVFGFCKRLDRKNCEWYNDGFLPRSNSKKESA